VKRALRRLVDLLVLLVSVSTLLFFALRLAGDPTVVMAGSDATEAQLAAIRAQYGFDKSLPEQYLRYMASLARLDFGASLATGQSALGMILVKLPATLLLASLGFITTVAIAFPVGAFLGFRPDTPGRRMVALVVYVFQGVPGFVLALLLIQVFVVQLGLLPSFGYADPRTWILPSIALASFLAPKLCRVFAANVSEAMREDYIRRARAMGATPKEILWKEALPNALLGAASLLSVQFATLISGVVIIEVLFVWPGVGWQLLQSTLALDFPVIQAFAVVVAVLVFAINTATDLLLTVIDPRLREAARE
jgi:ABC-type dipeptide/oligopeptide/nickel transport system permease component